ncbi:MAG: alkane 1-monooxygenase [Deltaproteobacteria bacterium]|nr:alkane 1-monooxygenase [Deltaproteobacteria bacterium]
MVWRNAAQLVPPRIPLGQKRYKFLEEETMSYLRYFLAPLLAWFAIIGVLMGGHWLWLGLVIAFGVMMGGDSLLGQDASKLHFNHPWILQIPLYSALPVLTLLLLSFAWATGTGESDFLSLGANLQRLFAYDFLAARAENSAWDFVGGVLGVGLVVVGWGVNVGHELTHRVKSTVAMLCGRFLLSMAGIADFAIEHVYGHHAFVGTPRDPATARRGENVYAFVVRSSIFGHISAWKHELKRLRRKEQNIFSHHNWMLRGYLLTVPWLIMFFLAGSWFGVLLFVAQAAFAKFILEIVNYIEHYGIVRKASEPIKPQHSWNTNHRMSAMILFSLNRHSAHHEKMELPYWVLEPYPDAPQLPYGYLNAIIVSLIPPLWFRVMDKKIQEWEAKYA